MPPIPRLHLEPPTIPQPYHLELWCEKTTVNDILEPLAHRYSLNVITGSGELSHTACVNVVERSEESGRPVRILYVSDFDPAGASMPVAVARKIEHRLYLKELYHLDIQVRPIVLTHDQCIEYRLPRTPIKETERRAAAFEARYGEGATELDALEALRPGELQRILETEIERYSDADLYGLIQAKAAETQRTIAAINRRVGDAHRTEIKALQSEWAEIAKEYTRRIEAWRKRAIRLGVPWQIPWPNRRRTFWTRSSGRNEPRATRTRTRCSTRDANTSSRSIATRSIRTSRLVGGAFTRSVCHDHHRLARHRTRRDRMFSLRRVLIWDADDPSGPNS